MDIQYVRTENSNPSDDRGWIYDRISAYHNDIEIGHVTISYIPSEIFKKIYPTILHYLWIQGGHCYSEKEIRDDFNNWTYEELIEFIDGIYQYDRITYSIPNTKNDCLKYLKKKSKEYMKVSGDNFNRFINYHVDKPEPAFVEVFPEYQGNGIATNLYIKASQWMQERSLRFYAADTQTNEARALWASMERKNMVEYNNGRKFIK